MKHSLIFAGLITLFLMTGCGGEQEPEMIDDVVRPPMVEETPTPSASLESEVTVVEPNMDGESEVAQ